MKSDIQYETLTELLLANKLYNACMYILNVLLFLYVVIYF